MGNRLPLVKMLTFGLLPSCLKKAIYRLKGNKIDKHVRLHWGSVIVCPEKFHVGSYTEVGYFTSIIGRNIDIGHHTNIRSAVIINATNITIGNDVTISETAIIRAGHLSAQSKLTIDDLVHVFPHTTIDPSRRIHLGEECAVGPGCSIFTHGSYKSILDGYPVTYGDVTIGKRVELTYNVFVAPGVTVGDDAIVAYGSYVNRDIPAATLAAGTPAAVKRTKEQFAPTPSDEDKASMLNNIMSEFNEHCSFIGLDAKDTDIKLDGTKTITADGCIFDIENHTCSAPKSALAKELRRFLSRYGIRFKTLQ